MTQWVEGSSIPPGEGRCFDVDGEHVAVVNFEGRFYSLRGGCLCAEKQRAQKSLEEIIRSCPNREWAFDLEDGPCQFKPEEVRELDPVESQVRFWEAGDDREIELRGSR